jgi:hypothetical protein
LDSTGSGQVPDAGCGECDDEPSGSCTTELVSYKLTCINLGVNARIELRICSWSWEGGSRNIVLRRNICVLYKDSTVKDRNTTTCSPQPLYRNFNEIN